MSEQSAQETANDLFSDALILAILSAYVYALAYAYESSFCYVFGIPADFIQIGLTNLLLVSFALFGLASALVWWVNPLFIVVDFPDTVLGRAIKRLAIALLFLFILAKAAQLSLKEIFVKSNLFFLGFVVLILGWGFVTPLISQRGQPTYAAKFEAAAKAHIPDLFDKLRLKLGNSAFVFIGVGLALIVLAAATGSGRASHQKNFLVTGGEPPLVILRIYGDNLIAAPLDRSTHSVSPSFRILKMAGEGTSGGPSLTLEEIGPLTSGAVGRAER